MFRRLAKHADSIQLAQNLELSDFFCRFLVLDEIWIRLGESLLIQRFVGYTSSRAAMGEQADSR